MTMIGLVSCLVSCAWCAGSPAREVDAGAPLPDAGSIGAPDVGPRTPVFRREPRDACTARPAVAYPALPAPGTPWSVRWRTEVDFASESVQGLLPGHGLRSYLGFPSVGPTRVFVVLSTSVVQQSAIAAFSRETGELLWAYALPDLLGPTDEHIDDNMLVCAPVATPDGGVLLATLHQELIALDADGVVRWTFSTDGAWPPFYAIGGIEQCVAIGAGGRVYYSDTDRTVAGLDACGWSLWRLTYPRSQPFSRRLFVVPDGSAVVDDDDSLVRVDPEGESMLILADSPTGLYGVTPAGEVIVGRGLGGARPSTYRFSFVRAWTGEVTASWDESAISPHPEGEAYRFPQVWGVLEPAGVLLLQFERTETETWREVWRWRRPDSDVRSLNPGGGGVSLSGDRVLFPTDAGLSMTTPTTTRRVLSWPGGVRATYGLSRDGLLVLWNGRELVAHQTDLDPGPGWSHPAADAAHSASLVRW